MVCPRERPTSDSHVLYQARASAGHATLSHEVVFVLIHVQAHVLVRLLLFVYLQQLIAALGLFPCTLLCQGALLLLPFPRRLAVEDRQTNTPPGKYRHAMGHAHSTTPANQLTTIHQK